MNKLYIFTVFLLQVAIPFCYGQQTLCEKTIEESLKQTAEILNKQESKDLWGVSLNAPIIIVNHLENKMYFTAIENGEIIPMKEEQWDYKVPLANSTFEYQGNKYVTVMYIALQYSSCEGRVCLLTHELFHYYQNDLGFPATSSANYHIDEVQGRALLQIEMKALQKALDGDSQSLHDALYLRAYRQYLYADNNEELFELHEGLAEYTGAKLSMNNLHQYVKDRLDYNINTGYTNSFAYATGAAYATILDGLYPQWRRDKGLNNGMTSLIKKTHPQYDVTIDNLYLHKLLDKYNHDQILIDEKEALNSFGKIDVFEKLLEPKTSKLHITNNGINLSYNPNDRVIALNNAVLLRNLTLVGEWGQIIVHSGIVRLHDWTAFYLLPPKEITTNVVRGDDYEMTLNKGWKVVEADGIYKLERSE